VQQKFPFIPDSTDVGFFKKYLLIVSFRARDPRPEELKTSFLQSLLTHFQPSPGLAVFVVLSPRTPAPGVWGIFHLSPLAHVFDFRCVSLQPRTDRARRFPSAVPVLAILEGFFSALYLRWPVAAPPFFFLPCSETQVFLSHASQRHLTAVFCRLGMF